MLFLSRNLLICSLTYKSPTNNRWNRSHNSFLQGWTTQSDTSRTNDLYTLWKPSVSRSDNTCQPWVTSIVRKYLNVYVICIVSNCTNYWTIELFRFFPLIIMLATRLCRSWQNFTACSELFTTNLKMTLIFVISYGAQATIHEHSNTTGRVETVGTSLEPLPDTRRSSCTIRHPKKQWNVIPHLRKSNLYNM